MRKWQGSWRVKGIAGFQGSEDDKQDYRKAGGSDDLWEKY